MTLKERQAKLRKTFTKTMTRDMKIIEFKTIKRLADTILH